MSALDEMFQSPESSRPRKRHRGLVTGVLIAVLVLAAAALGWWLHSYQDRALPGTTVLGQDVSGMNAEQVAAAIETPAAGLASSATSTVALSDSDGTPTVFSPADVGVGIDVDATAEQAVTAHHDFWGMITSVFSSRTISPETTSTDDAATSFAGALVPESEGDPVDAQVQLNGDGTAFEVVPGAKGRGIDVKAAVVSLQEQAVKAIDAGAKDPALLEADPSDSSTSDSSASDSSSGAASGSDASGSDSSDSGSEGSAEVTLEVTATDPVLTDDMAQKAADDVNGKIGVDHSISGPETFTASDKDKASWYTVTGDHDKGEFTIGVDEDAVRAFVEDAVKQTNIAKVDGETTVDSNGTVLDQVKDPKDGREVTNADDVQDALLKSVTDGTTDTIELATKDVKAETKKTTVDPDTYDADVTLPEGVSGNDKWVDIDLSSHTITAYEGKNVVHGPISMVNGGPETPTATGTYSVYLKYDKQTMRGRNADGSNYVTEDVPWVSYWYRGYAFHGAPWRNSFGYAGSQGSHGCINLPVSEAKWIYDFTEIGTVVYSHK